MKITDVRNLVFVNVEHTIINMEVKFAEFGDYVWYTASSIDTERHGQILYSKAIAGHYGPIAPYSGE